MTDVRPGNRRKFRRVDVRIPGRFRRVDREGARSVRNAVLERSSATDRNRDDEAIRRIARSGSDSEVHLAEALLAARERIDSLKEELQHIGGPMQTIEVHQLSGGGGRLTSRLVLGVGDLLDFWLEPGGDAAPVRTLAEVVHSTRPAESTYGFRFAAIHPEDRERLVRVLDDPSGTEGSPPTSL